MGRQHQPDQLGVRGEIGADDSAGQLTMRTGQVT